MNMIHHAWTAFQVGLSAVALVITLVFMLSTPVCTLGMPQLPFLETGTIVTNEPGDLRVSVSRHRPEEDTEASLRRLLATGQYKRIVIEADRRAKYGDLMPIFRAAQAHRVPVVFAGSSVAVLEQLK